MAPPSEPDDSRQLIERASEGDGAAIEDLLVDELPRLRAFVRLNVDELLRDRESCSDLVQSACREVLGHMDDFEYRGRAAFRGWLFSWTLNKIRDRRNNYLAERRHPKREVSPTTSIDASRLGPGYAAIFTPSQHAVQQEQLELVEAGFDRLTPAQREVLGLSRIGGLSHTEIAERTGREAGAVRVLLHRALARLSTALEDLDGERER